MNKIRKYFKLKKNQKAFIKEAFCLLAFYRVYIIFIPFRFIANRLERSCSLEIVSSDYFDPNIPKEIGIAISSISPSTPWESKCLIQSLTAYNMLKRRRYPCDLFLGVSKDINGKMIAHAWAKSNSIDVTGASIMDQFTITYHFK